MINLGSWMNKVLTGWGVDEKIPKTNKKKNNAN